MDRLLRKPRAVGDYGSHAFVGRMLDDLFRRHPGGERISSTTVTSTRVLPDAKALNRLKGIRSHAALQYYSFLSILYGRARTNPLTPAIV